MSKRLDAAPNHSNWALMTPLDLLRNSVPLIDLRSPGEFAQGAVPTAVNLPVLADEERAEVGALYRKKGRDAAISRGYELVSGTARAARMDAWQMFLADHLDAWIYCWRGGLRSSIVQSWLRQAGCCAPRVEGGYKQLRNACLGVFETLAPSAKTAGTKRWIVLAGRTGVGKTEVLRMLPQALDLEGLAQHRGSAFGGCEQPQPQPIAFENALAISYLQHQAAILVVEDESRTIGRLALPKAWFARMQQAPIVLLRASIAARIRHIRGEYVEVPLAQGVAAEELLKRHQASLQRILKRLGHERCRTVSEAMEAGFRNGDHDTWIGLLLAWYYDPMYDHQLRSKQRRVVFSGERAEVLKYLAAERV